MNKSDREAIPDQIFLIRYFLYNSPLKSPYDIRSIK